MYTHFEVHLCLSPQKWNTYVLKYFSPHHIDVCILKGSWGIFGDASVTIAQWRRAQYLKNVGYPQVPDSIAAENPSFQINMDLSQ